MSKLNISPNLFLEVNELNHLVDFLGRDGYRSYFKYLCKTFGIAQNKDNTFFKVSQKSGTKDTIIVNSGVAFDSELNRIYLAENKELVIPNTGIPQWLVISYVTTNEEEGTVNISSQGALNGTGTKFLSVLRGQPNFPTKVKFNSSLNNEEYEVVDVVSDTVASLVGEFTAETGLKYRVIGTFTPGFQPNDEDKAIYEYDSCRIDIIESENAPTDNENQFVLACVNYDENGDINISDERIRNLFNFDSEAYYSVNSLKENPLVSLKRTSIRGNNLDVQFEWGYKVTKFSVTNTAEQNIFNVVDGESGYIYSNSIPDSIFAGWLLINRKNMVSVIIDDNERNLLYISKFNSELITGEEDDFVIVPNVKDIEVEIGLNLTEGEEKDDYGDEKYFFKFSIENAKSRFNFPINYGKTLVKLRYRMMTLNQTSMFHNFSNVTFTNADGYKETLGESSFVVNINPESVKRNYS